MQAAAKADDEVRVSPCCCHYSAARFKPPLSQSSVGRSLVVAGDGDVDKWLVEMFLLVKSSLSLH